MIPATVGVFAISVFNFYNFYRGRDEEKNLEFYLLIICYEIFSVFMNVLIGFSVTVSSMNTSAVRYIFS